MYFIMWQKSKGEIVYKHVKENKKGLTFSKTPCICFRINYQKHYSGAHLGRKGALQCCAFQGGTNA